MLVAKTDDLKMARHLLGSFKQHEILDIKRTNKMKGGYLDLESRLRVDHFVFPASYKSQDASLTNKQSNNKTKQTNKTNKNKRKKSICIPLSGLER